MNSGPVRIFEDEIEPAAVLSVGLRAEKQHGWILIHMTGDDHSHTTVTNNPDSVLYHRTLFRDLRRSLQRQNRWLFGDDGAEIERQDEPAIYRPVPIRGGSISATIIEDRGER